MSCDKYTKDYDKNNESSDLKYWDVNNLYGSSVTLPYVFFKHFASKNQLPGFYISGTLVGNG